MFDKNKNSVIMLSKTMENTPTKLTPKVCEIVERHGMQTLLEQGHPETISEIEDHVHECAICEEKLRRHFNNLLVAQDFL
jgi:hypothetical protein